MGSSLCEYLEWDSGFFNLRIGRIRENSLTPTNIEAVLCWAQSERIDCLYFLSDSDNSESVACAELHGFHLVDIRVTLSQPLLASDAPVAVSTAVRFWRPADVPSLKTIAAVSHRQTRFYYDSRFPVSICDRLYETWIERSCDGLADCVLVVDFKGKPAGYLSCHLGSDRNGIIGLVAVATHARGRGLGRQLIDASLSYFQEHRMTRVNVVTQGRNCPSQHLYQSCGFRTQAVQLWYHKWFQTKE